MPHANTDDDLPPVHDTAVQAEQVRILYGSLSVQFMNLVNAPIVAALLWPIYPAWVLLTWIGLFFVVVGARVLLWRSYQHETSDERAGLWAGRFTLGTIVTGSLWGCLGSAVFMTEDPAYYVFAAFVLGGMTAGAAMRNTPHLPAFYGFAIPAVAPMIVAFLAKGLFITVEMGLLLTAFTVVLVVMGRDYHRWIIDGLRLKIAQATLNRDLQRITGELEQEVADREQISAALKESNERLSGIGENAQDPIIITDSDGNVVYWNPAAERTFGYKADEIMGRSAHRLLAAERFRQTAVEHYNHFAMTGQGNVLGKTRGPCRHPQGWRRISDRPVDLRHAARRRLARARHRARRQRPRQGRNSIEGARGGAQ